MSTPEELLAHMQRRVREQPGSAASDAEELGQLSLQAMARDAGQEPVPQQPLLDVRLHGPGITGHEVGVEDAIRILAPLQQALSSIGQSLANVPTAAGKIPEVIKRATKLRLAPAVSPGSVVFHLKGPTEEVTGDELPGLTGTETLSDMAMQSLMSVLTLADTTENTMDMAGHIRRFGPRSAKHLNDLAKTVVGQDIDVGLRWRSAQGIRIQALLDRRAALGLQGAISHNRSRTDMVTLTGFLATASTVEPAALRLDDNRLVKLDVAPDLAITLDRYCFRRVVVNAEERVVWHLTRGTETRHHRLLSIHLAE